LVQVSDNWVADRHWDAGVVLEVEDPQCFRVGVDFVGGSEEFIFGITQKRVALGILAKEETDRLMSELVSNNPANCFIHVGQQQASACSTLGSEVKFQEIPGFTFTGGHCHIEMYDDQVTFSWGAKTIGPYTVPHSEYHPCALFKWRDTAVRMSVSRKRRRSTVESLVDRLYDDRRFTDAVVRCGGHGIPVHRAFLAAASPVFERMLAGGMREASEAAIDIDDEEPSVVESAIRFIYTAVLPGDTNIVRLFGLAKKYELDALAELTARRMLDGLDVSNVLERARVVRLHANAGDVKAQELWRRLYIEIEKDRELMRGLVEALLE